LEKKILFIDLMDLIAHIKKITDMIAGEMS